MARESYTSYTLGEPIPHTGVESDLQRHPYNMKIKNKFSFGTPQDRPLRFGMSHFNIYFMMSLNDDTSGNGQSMQPTPTTTDILYTIVMFVHIRIKFPESRHQCIRSLTIFILVRLSIPQWLLPLEPTVRRVSLLP